MSEREWFPNGVVPQWPASIDDHVKKRIKRELVALGVVPTDWDAIFKDLSKAVAGYQSNRKIHESSSPAMVRGNLKGALELALKLNEKFNNFDGNSRNLVEEVSGNGVDALQDRLSGIVQTLSRASKLAEEYPQRGRLRGRARYYFAADIAAIVEKHCGIKPVAGRDGAFYKLLTVVLPIVTGKEAKEVHALASRTLRCVKIVQHKALNDPSKGGLKEYHFIG